MGWLERMAVEWMGWLDRMAVEQIVRMENRWLEWRMDDQMAV